MPSAMCSNTLTPVHAAGKTTLLRMIAGLESTSSGQIMFDGELVASAHLALAQLALPAPSQCTPCSGSRMPEQA